MALLGAKPCASGGKGKGLNGILVGAVGIELIKPQNQKELCGMFCSCKSFVVYNRNSYCPLIAP
jgi:hypothetical protein